MHKALHPRDSVAELYPPKKEVGWDLLPQSGKRLICTARKEGQGECETLLVFNKRQMEPKVLELGEQTLRGKQFRQTEDFSDPESWKWLREENLV